MRSVYTSALFGLGLMLMLSTGAGIGGQDKKDGVIKNWGQPKNFKPGEGNGFWIWHDDGTWHIRTTGGGKGAHQFVGKIEVIGGDVVDLKGKKGEYSGKNADRYVFTRTTIVFDFKTNEGTEGLNFQVSPGASGLKFSLALDGEANPKHIFIGKDGDHPAAAVFTLPAHPTNVKGKDKDKK